MRLSVSQLQSEELCQRKWWFVYDQKLREPRSDAKDYGSVTHGVLERYLMADDNGRDTKTGEPVDLYPDGWAGGLNPIEIDQIKRLVPLAVERGILARKPERLVEHEFTIPIGDTGHTLYGFIDLLHPDEVQDHKTTSNRRWALSPAKLNKSIQMRGYALVLRGIRRNAGFPDIDVRAQHNVFEKQLVKGVYGEGDVFPRKTVITVGQVEEFEAWLILKALELQAVKDRKISELDWSTVQGPGDKSDACNAYGGCPFRGICNESGDSVKRYKFRMERNRQRAAGELPDPIQVTKNEALPMASAKNRMAALLGNKVVKTVEPAAVAATTPPPAVPHAQVAPINPAPVASVATTEEPFLDEITPAPWANPTCVACKASKWPGFDSKGNVCKICKSHSQRHGGVSPIDYQPTMTDGVPTWSDPNAGPAPEPLPEPTAVALVHWNWNGDGETSACGAADGFTSFGAVELVDCPTCVARIEKASEEPVIEPTPDAGDASDAPAPVRRKPGRPRGAANKSKPVAAAAPEAAAPTPTPEDTPAAGAVSGVVPEESTPSEPTPPARSRAKNPLPKVEGFVLAFGVRPVAGNCKIHPKTVEFTRFFAESQEKFIEEMGEGLGVSSYWSAPVFDRRDMMAQVMPELVKNLEGMWLIVDSAETPDAKNFLEALTSFAGLVIR